MLAYELKLIRDNVHGGIKPNSNIDLTHSEVVSFTRAFVNAVYNQTINPFHEFGIEDTERVMLYLNLIRTHDIPPPRSLSYCSKMLIVDRVRSRKKRDFSSWISR